MKQSFKSLFVIALILALAIKITLTTFAAQSQVQANHFSTGKADLYLLKDLALAAEGSNLSHTLPGYTFDKIVPGWSVTQPLKLYNGGSVVLKTALSAQALADPYDFMGLSNQIQVQVAAWDDKNHNQVWEAGETSTPYGEWRSLSTWTNQPFDLGNIEVHQTKPLLVSFKVDDLDDSFQDSTTAYDFNFDAAAPTSGVH